MEWDLAPSNLFLGDASGAQARTAAPQYSNTPILREAKPSPGLARGANLGQNAPFLYFYVRNHRLHRTS
jgi:hypothetical protein